MTDEPRQLPASLTRRRLLTAAGATAAVPLLPGLSTATAAPHGGTPSPTPAAPGDGAGLRPYASYWYPESFPTDQDPDPGAIWRALADWRPQDDPDLPYNTSTVPLAERFTPVPAHPTARPDQARVSALCAFGTTAGNPAQGSADADYFAPTYWAYLDELVCWGGSAGEGIIVAPNAPVTDAAHRHGVPVLGTVFLPPAAYGGELRWTRELVQRDDRGRFPLADQLVRVARAYGFDGWFLNAETEGGDAALARDVSDFLHALRGEAPELRVTWYDAFNADGEVGWQGALNDRNAQFFQRGDTSLSDTFFIDFRWRSEEGRLDSSAAHARRLDRSPYELWAGVDVEAAGWESSTDWHALFPRDADHVVSLGYYRPEWTLHSLPEDTRTPDAFHRRDQRFWTGEHGDPHRPTGPGHWQPAARHVADRSTVTAVPFGSTFNTGHGLAWYEAGDRTGGTEWNQLGLQDVLPGRQWAVHTTGERPDVAFAFDAAWRGGSSLLVHGDLPEPAVVELYRTRLPRDTARVVELTHRVDEDAPEVRVELAVATEEPTEAGRAPDFHTVPAGTVSAGDGWTTHRVTLDALPTADDGLLHAVAVRLTRHDGGGPVRWRLGALTVHDGGAGEPPAAPGAPEITASRETGSGTAELRLRWRPSEPAATGSGPVRHYTLHQVLSDGSRRFLGGTTATVGYLPEVRRDGTERATAIEIRAVDERYASSPAARVGHRW